MSTEQNAANAPAPHRAASDAHAAPQPPLEGDATALAWTKYVAREPERARDAEVDQMWEAVLSTPHVRGVCADRGSVVDLWQAVYLVREAFGPLHKLRAEVDVDPDTDDHRVVLDVTVDAPADELLRRYGNYTRDWVASAPAGVREWVRLVFHPLRDA